MTFVTFLTLTLAAVLALGVTRAADRHRRWTLALVERHRRRVASSVEPGEPEGWNPPGDPSSGPAPSAPAANPIAPRRIELRVRE